MLLLAAIAFRQKRYDSAGQFFGAAMSSGDVEEVLEHLNAMGEEEIPNISAPPGDGISSVIASTLEAFSSESDLDESEEETEDNSEETEDFEDDDMDVESEDEDDEAEWSDDVDPETGDVIVPSSISNTNVGDDGIDVDFEMASESNSPVRIK